MITNKSPAMSVLMPVYNAEAYVAEAIESILAQSFTDFEFVIVDDGSTDRSKTIIESYTRQDDRIRLISRPNTGLPIALNDGLIACCGEFVARMDADDVALPQRFKVQIDYLRAFSECVAVGGGIILIDKDGDELFQLPIPPLTHKEIDCGLLIGKVGIPHPTVMIRKWAILQVEGYRDFMMGEDLDLWLRLGEIGKLANIPDKLLRYRFLCSSYSRVRRKSRSNEITRILVDAYRRRGILDSVPRVKDRNLISPSAFARMCAEFAMKDENRNVARKHAWESVKYAPLAYESWRVVAIAFLGKSLVAPLRIVVRATKYMMHRVTKSNHI